jgi:predicted nucleic acid-binding protein
MNAVDTNVLLYSLDNSDPVKEAKARQLLQQLQGNPVDSVLLWEVVGELVAQLRRWVNQGRITKGTFDAYVLNYRNLFRLTLPTPQVLDRALDLADRYSLSHWDSMLLGACIEASVDTLYPEDMGSPTRYDSVQLVNPFI